MRWTSRLRGRRLLAYIAFNTALGFVGRTWVLPYFKRLAEEQQRLARELRDELGREPTDDEVIEYVSRPSTRSGRA